MREAEVPQHESCIAACSALRFRVSANINIVAPGLPNKEHFFTGAQQAAAILMDDRQ
jgi:hypothetical protein